MQSVIKKWGNSPALRLPLSAMKVAAFDLEQRVTITVSRGRILIEPCHTPQDRLSALLAKITPENLHDEADFGAPVGNEAL